MIYKKFNDFIRRKNFGLLILGLSMILILIISLISFMSYKTANAQSNSSNNKNFSNIKQIDEYFYEITYSDYEFDEKLETRESDAKMHNNCLGIRNGNFYGRNFDHTYDTSPAFLVKMKKSNDRFASIGLCYYYTLTKEYLENNDCDHELDILPNNTLDGINEFGVVCQFNSVKLGDTETLVGTNPSAQDLYIGFAVRKILDHATSADHAISILANSNLVGQLDDKHTAQFMISDKEKTYIVDLLDNKLITNQVFGKDAIMTNFHKNIGYISN